MNAIAERLLVQSTGVASLHGVGHIKSDYKAVIVYLDKFIRVETSVIKKAPFVYTKVMQRLPQSPFTMEVLTGFVYEKNEQISPKVEIYHPTLTPPPAFKHFRPFARFIGNIEPPKAWEKRVMELYLLGSLGVVGQTCWDMSHEWDYRPNYGQILYSDGE